MSVPNFNLQWFYNTDNFLLKMSDLNKYSFYQLRSSKIVQYALQFIMFSLENMLT